MRGGGAKNFFWFSAVYVGGNFEISSRRGLGGKLFWGGAKKKKKALLFFGFLTLGGKWRGDLFYEMKKRGIDFWAGGGKTIFLFVMWRDKMI